MTSGLLQGRAFPYSPPTHEFKMIPFLKWPGGKRWLVQNYSWIFPKTFNRYIEPFLGSGAVYFHLQPKRALLADKNVDLITAYKGAKHDATRLVALLERHHKKHNAAHYYKVRSSIPEGVVEQAARIIYLNRTCFNGIYRVNREGIFNVPIGNRQNVIFPTDDFPEIARLLHRASLRVADFERTIGEAVDGDLIFVDPPYTVRHNNNGFIKYNDILFRWQDQERLVEVLAKARDRGAKIVGTNANHEPLREMYKKAGFSIKVVSRFSPISASVSNRRQFEEMLVLSD